MHKKGPILKRAISFALTACMLVTSLTPTFAYAAEPSDTIPNISVTEQLASTPPDSAMEKPGVPGKGTTEHDETSQPPEVVETPSLTDPPDAEENTGEETPEPSVTPAPEGESGEDSGLPEPSASPSPEPSATPNPDASPEPSLTPEPDISPEPSASPEPTDGESEVAPEENSEPEEEFEPIVVLDPEEPIVTAEVGEEVTLTSGINREDVQVEYQWQRFQNPLPQKKVTLSDPIYEYSEGEPTWYRFLLADTTEMELLAENPESTWSGIELFYAAKQALDDIGAQYDNLTFAWKTPNFALDGYAISAAIVDGVTELYAKKEDERYVARLNEYGEFVFVKEDEAVPVEATETNWQDIEGATEPSYTFTVEEADHYANFRLKVTIRDEAYLEQVVGLLENQDVVLTEEQKAEDQILYSVVMQVESAAGDEPTVEKPMALMDVFSNFVQKSVSGSPRLSDDGQWIENLNGNYEYITEDAYNRIKKWYDEDPVNHPKAYLDASWTWLQPKGFNGHSKAPAFGSNGYPIVGQTRDYNGFTLTDGHKLEVASEWYGKTVYFRLHGQDGKGTAIKIPAYTELYGEGNKYEEAQSGSRYKKAVTFLNAWVPDVGAVYRDYLRTAAISYDNPNKNSLSFEQGTHITSYDVSAEAFNADPARYMVDAEGNYRMDSVGWGVCVYQEPDISGKAYWLLKDYISNGYGFLTGHDTLYAYAGAYYDAYGKDLDESTIDPNDGITWYYDVNSWQPTAHTSSGQQSSTRGGHFYLNELMGTNKGSVYSGNVKAADAPSLILSTGGSHGPIGKDGMFADNNLRIVMNGFDGTTAAQNPRYRTPTNFPYSYASGEIIAATYTHTNGQAAFGPIWVDYAGPSWQLIDEEYGKQSWTPGTKPPEDKWRPSTHENSLTWQDMNGNLGTNNFYLTGVGNYLMNQIGHIPKQDTSHGETRLFVNSVMFVSQRKQCEICAANQGGQQTSHFVRRVSAANFDEVTEALRNGGSYWYPIDGCYQLTEDVRLPEGWTPIKGFKGHWNSDVYDVALASNGEPLLENRVAEGPDGWNLGTNPLIGTPNVFNTGMTRTTGVARVVGDLNDLFGGQHRSYNGYTVKIRGVDNPKYFSEAERNKEFTCMVNSDSKYVISNLPCLYEKGLENGQAARGTLVARVYDETGKEVVEYGPIRVDVKKEFWNNDMTTPLYLGNFSAKPVEDYTTYESGQAQFFAEASSAGNIEIGDWEYSSDNGTNWQPIPSDWDISVEKNVIAPDDSNAASEDYVATTSLTLNKVNPAWNGYHFRATFKNPQYGEWNSYRYYVRNRLTSNEPFEGAQEKNVCESGKTGLLSVKQWPAYTEQGPDQIVFEGEDVTFRAYGYALDDGSPITAKWQYTLGTYDSIGNQQWFDVDGATDANGSPLFGNLEQVVIQTPVRTQKPEVAEELMRVAPTNNVDLFWQNAQFHGVETELTIKKADLAHNKLRFRVEFTAESGYGTALHWWSDIANDLSGSWTTPNGRISPNGPFHEEVPSFANRLKVNPPDIDLVTVKSQNFPEGSVNQDLSTPDEYGQTVGFEDPTVTLTNENAVYRAEIYYRPEKFKPEAVWQYQTYTNRTPKPWNTQVAHDLGYTDTTVTVVNSQPIKTTYKGEAGWMMYTSTMTVNNVPVSMYNPEQLTKYFFRCVASTSYQTAQRTKTITATDKWGGLTIDYKIYIKHNGVMEYDKTNIINGQIVTDGQGIFDAANGHQYSDWYYNNLEVKAPQGHHINTAIVAFDDSVGYNSSDEILVDTIGLSSLGIQVEQQTPKSVLLVSHTANTVELDAWNKALREYVGFRSYDADADFSLDKIISGQTGGGGIKWMVDEARLAGTQIDLETGKVYKLVTFDQPVDWAVAKQAAQTFDSELQMSGKLAEPQNETERNAVQAAAAGHNVWLGGYKDKSNAFRWDSNGNVIDWIPWTGNAVKTNANLYMKPDGTWNSGPNPKSQGGGSEEFTMPIREHASPDSWGWRTGSPFYTKPAEKYHIVMRHSTPDWSKGWIALRFETNNANNWDADGHTGIYKEAWYYAPEIGHNSDVQWESFDIVAPQGSLLTGLRLDLWNPTEADVTSVTAFYPGQEVEENPVDAAVIEYTPQSLAVEVTNHSATDDAVIGTRVKNPPNIPKGHISAIIKGNGKVYDGTPITPSEFSVIGKGADRSLFNVTYTAFLFGNHANYPTKTVNGNDYLNTGAINATTYHVKIALTEAALAEGWVLDEATSQLECYLTVFPRPIDVSSYHNNKEYDGTADGIIRNIQIDPGTDANSGIINSDIVELNCTEIRGSYTQVDGNPAIHNSDSNNGGMEYTILKNVEEKLEIVHNATSDPYWNYALRNKTFTGAIIPRELIVHSEYIEPEHSLKGTGRNIKSYDGTTVAVVKGVTPDGEQNIFIDHANGNGPGIIPADHVSLDKMEYTGQYATKDAYEKLYDTNGHEVMDGSGLPPKKNRFLKLTENVITLDRNPTLVGNDYGDYKIIDYTFSGAIYRTSLEVKAKTYRYMYGTEFTGDRLLNGQPLAGDEGYPRPYDKIYEANKPSTLGSWISVDGLVPGEVLTVDDRFSFDSYNADGSIRKFDTTTPVGDYDVEIHGLNEMNYPILKNYLVQIGSGSVSVYPREIIITPEDIDCSIEQDKEPLETFAHFKMMNDDGETFTEIGNDRDSDYDKLHLANGDTVLSTILLDNGQPLVKPAPQEQRANAKNETYFKNVSAVPFWTMWHQGAPVKYANIQTDAKPHNCDWCEHYYGHDALPSENMHHKKDTAHWTLNGYLLRVNNDSDFGAGTTLKVATVKNLNGEDVQNYEIRYEDAQLRVHPKQRFQLKATVPMYVCMYGFASTGDVVTPSEYGIRNYSNGPIQIENIEVSNDGWVVTDKNPQHMSAGEISLRLHGMQLKMGDNHLLNPDGSVAPEMNPQPRENWVIARDDTPNNIGIWSRIPIEAQIAGDFKNARKESYVTHITYTVGEYGWTLPEVPDVELPENINGNPVTIIPDEVSYADVNS